MSGLSHRFEQNPILYTQDIQPSTPGFVVEGVLNPGAFTFEGKTWLLLRVAAVNRASVRTKMHRRWIYCYDARRAAFWIKLILKRTKEAKPNGN